MKLPARPALPEYFLAATLITLFFTAPLGASPLIIWPCLLTFYFYFFASFSTPIAIVKGIPTYFKVDLLYYLFYYILLYYPYQTYVLGSDSIFENHWVGNSYIECSNKAILASTIGLLAFNFGYRRIYKYKDRVIWDFSQQQYNVLYLGILILTCAVGVGFVLSGGLVMLAGAYHGSRTKNATIDGLYNLLSVCTSVLAGFALIYYKKYKAVHFLFLPAALIFMGFSYLTLVGGDRNTLFIVLVALLGGFYSYLKRISRQLLIVYAFLALFLYQVLEISRTANDRSLESIVGVVTGETKAHASTKISANIDEGSFSITNLVTRAAFHFVPDVDDHSYGKYFMIGIAGFIPFARGVVIDPNDPNLSSSRYISNSIGSRFGLGSSIVMDSYIEFGLIGVMFVSYLLGAGGKYIQGKAQRAGSSMKWGVTYLLTLATYAEIPRYTLDFTVKTIGWGLLIFVVHETIVYPARKQGKPSRMVVMRKGV